MGTVIDFADNPFFHYDMCKLCAVCNKKLDKEKYMLLTALPKQHSNIKVIEVLMSISDFNGEFGPKHVCPTCYLNTVAAFKFQTLCNKSQERLTNYLKHQSAMKIKQENEVIKWRNTKKTKAKKHDCTSEPKLALLPVAPAEEHVEDVDVASEALIDTEVGMVTMHRVAERDEVKFADEERSVDEEKSSMKSNESDVNDLPSTIKKAKCKVCHKVYRADYLSVHMRIHTGERPYRCRICNKAFRTSTILKLHRASHSEVRKFMCRFCGKGYKLFRTLQVHERSHTGEKPFKCNYCEKAFTSASRRKQHQLVHTGAKEYTCEVCAKSFTRMTILKDHQKSHAGVKDFSCYLCGNLFTQAHSLRSHLVKSCRVKKDALKVAEEEESIEVYLIETDEEAVQDGE